MWSEKKKDSSFWLLLLLTDAQNVRPLATIMSAVPDEKNKYILTNIYLKEEEE
jgi:hypothetical protein